MTNIKFENALNRVEQKCPPIWMMRQAGRYQPSYMQMKEEFTFEQMCKLPQLASKTAMLPIKEFDFDVAILFSDILWHLEGLGLPLKFDPGPKFQSHLTEENWEQYKDISKAIDHLEFQHKALTLTREMLPRSKSLVGFVGGPWSLLNYALGNNKVSNDFKTMYLKKVIIPLLSTSITHQKACGAEVVMIFDSGLQNISKNYYDNTYLPMLKLLSEKENVAYYARGLPKNSLPKVKKLPWTGIGIDSTQDLVKALKTTDNMFIQGNFNEEYLLLEHKLFNYELDKWLESLDGIDTTGWVCGLGHGIIKTTPTANVKHFIEKVRNHYA